MKRGFPRPRTKVGNLRSLWRIDLNKKWGNREYPHPYSAEEDTISNMHIGRQRECMIMHRCSVCGDTISGDIAYLITNNGAIFDDSGPFHEKCRTLAFKMCPYLAEYKKYKAYDCSWTEFGNSAPVIEARTDWSR